MSQDGLKEYVRLGHYFTDARKWYNYKYLSPIAHKAWAFYTILILIIMLAALGMNIKRLLPIKQIVSYGVSIDNKMTESEENASIIKMDDEDAHMTPVHFISGILLKNYLISRESYNYESLTKQFIHLKNTSTRVVFKRFYDYMNIDNPDSPVLRYQKYAKRNIVVDEIKFPSDSEAIIKFTSTARDSSNKIFENLVWEAKIGFDMGNLKTKSSTGSKFDFTVTDYTLKLLGEKQ